MQDEINRCLGCMNNPCHNGCPLNNNPKEFIKLVKENKIKEAFLLLSEKTCLSSICGRVCLHEKQCQSKCTLGYKGNPIDIGRIEAYIWDTAIKEDYSIPCLPKNNKKVAIIGSGPSGLTCAYFLAKNGYNVTIYEQRESLGGILKYGIPSFRLEKDIVDKSINKILSLGINVIYNTKFGIDISLKDLESQYDAIYLAIGKNHTNRLGLPNEDLPGIYGGNELLEYANYPDFTNKVVSIIGGGNVAIDCARTIKRLNAKKVNIIYRRNMDKMKASKKEIKACLEENINIIDNTDIVGIKGIRKVTHIELVKTEQKEELVNIEKSNYLFKSNYLIKAIGSHIDTSLFTNLNIKDNYLEVNDYQTSIAKVFAGGDLIGTNSTIAYAACDGRNAAEKIIKYLQGSE